MKQFFRLFIICISIACVSCSKNEGTDTADFDYKFRVLQDCVENEIVRDYMKSVNYTDGDYTYSLVKPYYDSQIFTSPHKYAPISVSLGFRANSSVYRSHTVKLTDDKDFERIYPLAMFEGALSVYNLVPGRNYRAVLYGVRKQTRQLDSLCSLNFSPSGQVRMIYVPSIRNVRDLGGWKSTVYTHADGTPKTIRYGRLYRGGELDRSRTLSDAGREVLLEDLKIGADADFRNSTECAEITCSALGEDFPYNRISTSSYSSSVNSDTHARDFMWILENLRAGRNVYFHCVAGADRTGTMAFLLEGLLGVSENNQCKDWELTCFYEWRSRTVGETFDYGKMVKTYLTTFNTSSTADACVAYFRKYGIDDSYLEEFRSIMLE